MAAKKTSGASPKSAGQIYIVGPRGGAHETDTFRSSTSGQFTTRVMSNGAYRSASRKANTVLKEVLKNPPTVQPDKK